jgi:hypothetical protein
MTSLYSSKYVCVCVCVCTRSCDIFQLMVYFCGHLDLELMYKINYFCFFQCLRAVAVPTSLLVHDCYSVLYTV